MAVKHVAAAVGVVGTLLLVCGLPMLLVPSQRTRDVQRYNDAAIQLMEQPPLAFVPSERLARGLDPRVVGTVSTADLSANLTIVAHPAGAQGSAPWGMVSGARWWLTAELNYTITRTLRNYVGYETVVGDGLTFALGNLTFHRAFPFQAEKPGVSLRCGVYLDPGDRRMMEGEGDDCSRASLEYICIRDWVYANFSGRTPCPWHSLCGSCIDYVYPQHLCTVVDVDGLRVVPSDTFQSCFYPFNLAPNYWREFDDGRPQYASMRSSYRYSETTETETRTLRITVLPSGDPSLVTARLTKGDGFDDSQGRRSTGLGFVIAGGVLLVLDGAALVALAIASSIRSKPAVPADSERNTLQSVANNGGGGLAEQSAAKPVPLPTVEAAP